MSRIVLSLLALGLFSQARLVAAQESAPAAEVPAAEEAAATTEEQAPAEEGAEAEEAKPEKLAPTPEGKKAYEAFDVVLQQWKDVTAKIPATQAKRQPPAARSGRRSIKKSPISIARRMD